MLASKRTEAYRTYMLSVFDTGPARSCPSPFNLAAHVLRLADDMGSKPALVVIGQTPQSIGFTELRQQVLGCATGLLKSGLISGDKLLMRIGNTPDFPIAYLAAIAVGIVPIPTSAQLTAPEVRDLIDMTSPKAILLAPDVACPQTDLPVFSPDDLSAWRELPPANFELGDPDRLAYIIFTSGTSGRPRAVGHAHRAIWARQMMFQGWHDLRATDRMMHAGAFNWTYTLGTGLMDPWSVGATALIPAAGTPIELLPDLIRDHSASIFAAVPGVYRKLLKSPLPEMPSLRRALSAGEKLSDSVRDAWQTATQTPLLEAYGMSECSTFISGSVDVPAKRGALGVPQPGRRVALLDDAGDPVAINTPGVIAVATSDPGLMLGYLDGHPTSPDKFKNGWFLTGDLGQMDDSGQITHLGRADDMMNAGGYRVSPIEVETALTTLPGIDAVACTDIEIKDGVRLIAAFYTGPSKLDDDILHAHAQAKLATYKQPRFFYHLNELPTGPNGKLLRRALRDHTKHKGQDE